MLSKNISALFLFLLLPVFLFGQFLLPEKSLYFTTDGLANLYSVNKAYEITKYNAKGLENFRYSNTRLDAPEFIDATDPFNILVFYPDYQTVILLDRTMTETAVLNLIDFDFFNINAVAVSSDNKLWIYDELNFRLKKIDRNGEVMQESDDLSLLLRKDFKPNFITEREQKVFVNDPEVGILVFDFFGQYIKTLEFKGLEEFQVFRDFIIFRDEAGVLQKYHLKSLLVSPLKMPENFSATGKIRYETGYLFAETDGVIAIYTL